MGVCSSRRHLGRVDSDVNCDTAAESVSGCGHGSRRRRARFGSVERQSGAGPTGNAMPSVVRDGKGAAQDASLLMRPGSTEGPIPELFRGKSNMPGLRELTVRGYGADNSRVPKMTRLQTELKIASSFCPQQKDGNPDPRASERIASFSRYATVS